MPNIISLARRDQNCSDDPFNDPQNDPCNPAGYIASIPLAVIGLCLYAVVASIHTYNIWKRGARWMAIAVIGAWTFAAGLAVRIILHSNPDSLSVYIPENLLIVLSPCAFIAADYILLGRLSRHLHCGGFLLIDPRRITFMFVCSDIFTFFLQGTGGSVTAISNSLANIGSDIFLGGLCLQLISFVFFTFVFFLFLYRVRRYKPDIWDRDRMLGLPWYKDWRALAFAITVSCIGITIRSFYRVIEQSEGFRGSLTENEPLFYALDTLPIFVAISIYIPFWPGRFIGRIVDEQPNELTYVAVRDNGSK